MRKTIKRFASRLLIPLTKWYLRKERSYRKGNIIIKIFPGVFHPGLFSSTNFLWRYLQKQNLKNKSLLELGCGSGFLSIAAAKAGARVTASDLSSIAISNTKVNAGLNNVSLNIISSDLFDNIIHERFDWIIINPPYYAGIPKEESDLSWYCGENFEYFQKLFSQLKEYLHKDTAIVMVLTLGCELQKIFSIAKKYGFEFHLLKEKDVFFDEKDFLYAIHHVNSSSSTQA